MTTFWCEFIQDEATGRWYCPVCDPGKKRTQKKVSKRTCEALVVPPEEFADDLAKLQVQPTGSLREMWREWRYAVERWRKAGQPVRNDGEMEACLSVCRQCEHYAMRAKTLGYCTICGCNVSTLRIGQLNKIRMATENCPESRWPALTETNGDTRVSVVFFSHALWRGGAERWLVDVATGLDREKFDVTIVLDNGKRDPDLLRRASTTRVAPLKNWRPDRPVDLLVCWSTIPRKIKARHTVFCLHGTGKWSEHAAAHVGAMPGVHLAAVSDAAGRLLAKYGQVQTIYNGCNTDRLIPRHGRDEMRRRLGIGSETIVVGFLGRMAALKRPHLVAQAACALRQRGIDSRSMFVGDHQAQHARRAEQVKAIDNRAILTGPQERIADYLAAMDVMMLPSESEGFSLAKIEAWLAGVPVVATTVGAVPELEDKHGSLVVRVGHDGEPDALADAVGLAVSPLNAAVVSYAKQLAWQEFTLEKMVTRWEEYLLSL